MPKDRPDLDIPTLNRQRIAEKAEQFGWTVTNEEPFTLEKGEKAIQINFNSAGTPNGAMWLHGDEFADMSSSGYMNLPTLFEFWLPWEPKGGEGDAAIPVEED
jgi:hypothetical protein